MNRLPVEYANARIEAKARGDTTYMGRPCKKGHDGIRYLKGGCVHCAVGGYYADRPRVQDRNKTWRRNNRERVMWLAAKHRAETSGREFDIEISDVVIPELCPVFGTPIVNPSLDRVDNSKGYVRGNVRVVSKRANTLKSSATLDELKAIVAYMEREQQVQD